MNTFQSICAAIIHGFAQFLPVGEHAHQILLAYFTGWPEADALMMGVLSLGSLLALLVIFRHDWASIISGGLQVVFLWRRPMTLDERMPLFLFLTALPTGLAWYYFSDSLPSELRHPLWVAAALALTCVPLWLSDRYSRRNRTMSFWNWKDALVVGITQTTLLIPGVGRQAGAICGAQLLNYNRESVYKFAFLSFVPILVAQAYLGLKGVSFSASAPGETLSWLSFWVSLAVTFLTSLIALGGMMKSAQQNQGTMGVIPYRLGLALATAIVFWMRSRGQA